MHTAAGEQRSQAERLQPGDTTQYLVQHHVGVHHQVVLRVCGQLVGAWVAVRICRGAAPYVLAQVVLPHLLCSNRGPSACGTASVQGATRPGSLGIGSFTLRTLPALVFLTKDFFCSILQRSGVAEASEGRAAHLALLSAGAAIKQTLAQLVTPP